ncbi:MAG: 16S rRNA (cytosine(967)-C(5))-methyltransferase RsmB [Gemmatimonadales bacterium]
MTGARRAALRILEGVREGLPFNAARDAAVQDLDDRDRRLAHELAAGVLRRQTALDDALAPLVPRGWGAVDPSVQAILRLGAYQLAVLERVPPHAAVSTSVDLARESAGPRAAGFVNAVLRRLGRRPLEAPATSGDPARDLARRHSHPVWLVARWLARFGPAETEALLAWNDRPPDLVVQPAREELDALLARWQDAGIAGCRAPYGAGIVLEHRSPTTLPGYQEGAFMVQDPAQALVARFAAPPPDGIVFDACAAPGGKTLALGRGARHVVAAELDRVRAARLTLNLKRAGSGRESVILSDALQSPVRGADLVLLDAPCLGTGTFARHPDARWRARRGALGALVRRQAGLLRAVATAVPPGALLVYATCSLEPEENQVQIDRFLEEHPGFRREPGSGVPAELLSPAGDLTLLPQRHGMDGGFAARLRSIG